MLDIKSVGSNFLKEKRLNVELLINFSLILIAFFITQAGSILIGFTYLEGNLAIQVLVLAISNFILYKMIRFLKLL